MFVSVLDVRGADDVVRRVRDCWASTFGARVLFYRVKEGQPADQSLADRDARGTCSAAREKVR